MGASILWWKRFVEKVSFEPGMEHKYLLWVSLSGAVKAAEPALVQYSIAVVKIKIIRGLDS